MPKRNVIRVGDRVRIVNPEKFIRCGYPFDVAAERDRIMSRHAHALHTLVNVIDPNPAPDMVHAVPGLIDVAHALAKVAAARHHQGGNERTIHTERDESLLQWEWSVVSKKYVRSGVYSHGRSYGEEYEGPSLDNGRTHVILELSPKWDKRVTMLNPGPYNVRIEACNTEKLT